MNPKPAGEESEPRVPTDGQLSLRTCHSEEQEDTGTRTVAKDLYRSLGGAVFIQIPGLLNVPKGVSGI